jgi:hypothetical protein
MLQKSKTFESLLANKRHTSFLLKKNYLRQQFGIIELKANKRAKKNSSYVILIKLNLIAKNDIAKTQL